MRWIIPPTRDDQASTALRLYDDRRSGGGPATLRRVPHRQNFTVPIPTKTASAMPATITTVSAPMSTPDSRLLPTRLLVRLVTTESASWVISRSSPNGSSVGTTKRWLREVVTAWTTTPGLPAGVRIRPLATSLVTSAQATVAATA